MPTASQLVQQGYGGYAGWGDAEAAQDFQKTGGSGKFTGQSGNQGGSSNLFQQQNQLQQSAIRPAIESLQSQIPTIQKNYQTQISQKQAEIAPLTERYTNLINQIKGQSQQSLEKQTRVTAGELGKRGIEGSSTLAGQEIASATLPIEQQTQALIKDTGFAQEADIRDIQNAIANLGGQQTEREQAIQQAIAQLQSGAGQSALSNAAAIQQAQAKAQSDQSKGQIETIGGGKYLVNPYTGAKTYLGPATSGTENGLSEILKSFGVNQPEPKPAKLVTPQTSVPDYAVPVQTSNVLGNKVTGLGPQDLIQAQPQNNWWNNLFGGGNYANTQLQIGPTNDPLAKYKTGK